jgi:hypothetical protein
MDDSSANGASEKRVTAIGDALLFRSRSLSNSPFVVAREFRFGGAAELSGDKYGRAERTNQ